jgi:flagellar biosynthesis protein
MIIGKKDKKQPQLSAVALKHERESEKAPRVVAKGRGYIARKIIELAEQHNIPVREDPDLLELLSAIELNEEIPPELYRVIAEILAMIYRVNGRM